MKKILYIILAVTIITAMTITASAVEPTPTYITEAKYENGGLFYGGKLYTNETAQQFNYTGYIVIFKERVWTSLDTWQDTFVILGTNKEKAYYSNTSEKHKIIANGNIGILEMYVDESGNLTTNNKGTVLEYTADKVDIPHVYYGSQWATDEGFITSITYTSININDMQGNVIVSDYNTPTYADGVLGWFQSLFDSITSLPGKIGSMMYENIVQPVLNGIKSIFIPSEDYMSEKINALRNKFAFADSIISTGEAIAELFEDTNNEPPKIEMHLQNAESKYDYGGTVYAIDMTWYARYKPTVDVILSAIILLYFAWRVYIKLPSIISGVSADVHAIKGR